MQRRKFLGSVSLTLAAAAFGPRAARADDVPKAAAAFVQTLADQVIAILKNKSLGKDDRVNQLADVFLTGFDVRAIGLFVLGRFGRDLPLAERNDYLVTFKTYVVETYAVRFNTYAGEQFSVTKETPDGPDGAWVFSDIGQKGEEPIEVQWRVRKIQEGLKIVDVVVEGVSLIVTQRSEFASILQHNGGSVSKLTDLLRNKIQELKKVDKS
jgi:phospholipid transport system substrate-binding protein